MIDLSEFIEDDGDSPEADTAVNAFEAKRNTLWILIGSVEVYCSMN